MLESDPEDEGFGMSVCDPLYGDQLVARADGQSIGGKSLRRLVVYVHHELADMRTFWRTDYEDRKARAREMAESKLTVEAFRSRA